MTTKDSGCCQAHHNGWLCTLDDGHDGQHEAWGVARCWHKWGETSGAKTAPEASGVEKLIERMRSELGEEMFRQAVEEVESTAPGLYSSRIPATEVKSLMLLAWWRGYSAHREILS